MKTTRSSTGAGCAVFLILCVGCRLHAGEAVWTASSGLSPENVNPSWGLSAYPVFVTVVLEADAVRLRSTNGYIGFYQGDNSSQHELYIPTNLTLEARVRVVSGTAKIYFVTELGVENWLSIGADEIFVNAGARTSRGAAANVDTDGAFHNYRIEVNGVTTGSTFKVFYDGTLALTGALYFEDRDQSPEIFWGSYPSGESLWQSFRHNGSTTPALAAYTAAEICWPSKTNRVYQVQWAPSLPSTNWTGLGLPTQGTGAEICIFDSTRVSARRFYRVEVVQ